MHAGPLGASPEQPRVSCGLITLQTTEDRFTLVGEMTEVLGSPTKIVMKKRQTRAPAVAGVPMPPGS